MLCLIVYRFVSESVFLMEFHEKLQELRKQKGLTQEELAAALYVSRTAVSKWESGRGYPNIDSLKAIARYFSVTIDELLSGDELLTLAEADTRQKETRLHDLMFGLLDCSSTMLLFLPFFRQTFNGGIQAVSLLALTEIPPYLKLAYFLAAAGMILSGILTLALQNCQQTFWLWNKRRLSLGFRVVGVLLFIVGLQPYAAAFLFLFLMIKMFLIAKKG